GSARFPHHRRSGSSRPRKDASMFGRSLAGGATILFFLLLAAFARAEFPYSADPNRCDSSGLPLGCISLANEMTGAAGSCNGDGVFNVPDYDGDPAVTDVNGNGLTDPQDLIMLFSNGVDDDGNGYADDISGWDFFEFDNDPFDDVQYGHGTGEAEDSTAEA